MKEQLTHPLNTLPFGQETHFSSPSFPIDKQCVSVPSISLQGLDNTALFTLLSLMQNANNSTNTPATYNSDATFVPPHHNAAMMNPNYHDTFQFFLPDANSEDEENRDDNPDDGHLSTITHLSRLNLVLYKHLANMNMARDKTPPTVTNPTSPEDPSTANSRPAGATNLDIGQLLSLTDQFKTLLDQLLLVCSQQPHASSRSSTATPRKTTSSTLSRGKSSSSRGASPREPYDPSTALLVLSCYLRLKQVYGRALRILHQLLGRERESEDLPELLPDVVIEGFSLAGHPASAAGRHGPAVRADVDRAWGWRTVFMRWRRVGWTSWWGGSGLCFER